MTPIIIDIERMKDFYCGLGQYCWFLYNQLWQHPDVAFLGHVSSKAYLKRDIFKCRPWHKLGINLPKSKVWHSTHQDASYFPYGGNVKVVLTIHDMNYIYQRIDRTKKVNRYRKMLQSKIDRADHVTFISKNSKKNTETFFNLNGKKTSIVYNGVSVSDVEAQKIEIKSNRPFLLSIVKFLPKKNLKCLIPALKFMDYDIVFAGDDTTRYGEEVRACVKEYGMENRCHFVGRVDEKEKKWALENCIGLVMPSILEGFGLPVVEAHHYGKPTFLSKETSLPEIGGKYSFYFSDFSPKTIAETINSGLKSMSNNLEEKLKENARRFSWEKAANEYYQIYQSLM